MSATRAKQTQPLRRRKAKALWTLGLLWALAPAAAHASVLATTGSTSAGGPSQSLLQTPWAQAMLRDSGPTTGRVSAATVTAADVAPASTPVGPITESQIADQLLKLMARNGGVLPDNVFVQSLERRRNLDPGRFDFWHPHVGEILASHTPTPSAPPPTITAQQITPPSSPPPPPIVGPNLPPHVATPEPSSAVIALALAASAGWLRRKTR